MSFSSVVIDKLQSSPIKRIQNFYKIIMYIIIYKLLNFIRINSRSGSPFYRYYFDRCSFGTTELVPLPYSQERSTCYSDRLNDFSVMIPRCCKDVYANSFFPCTVRLRNSLHLECFPLTYDLNGFKSRINKHLLTVGSF